MILNKKVEYKTESLFNKISFANLNDGPDKNDTNESMRSFLINKKHNFYINYILSVFVVHDPTANCNMATVYSNTRLLNFTGNLPSTVNIPQAVISSKAARFRRCTFLQSFLASTVTEANELLYLASERVSTFSVKFDHFFRPIL